MIIKIKNLKLRTIVGIYNWEKDRKQDVIINIELEVSSEKALKTDDINDTINYKDLNNEIISAVESRKFYLIEKIADTILEIVLKDKRVVKAIVEIDKPGALQFSDSVSVICSRKN